MIVCLLYSIISIIEMMLENIINSDNNNHSVFLLYYHLVLVIKYRRGVIDDIISNKLKEIFERVQSNYNITLHEWNHDKDYVHILFKAHPNSELSKFINAAKNLLKLAM